MAAGCVPLLLGSLSPPHGKVRRGLPLSNEKPDAVHTLHTLHALRAPRVPHVPRAPRRRRPPRLERSLSRCTRPPPPPPPPPAPLPPLAAATTACACAQLLRYDAFSRTIDTAEFLRYPVEATKAHHARMT